MISKELYEQTVDELHTVSQDLARETLLKVELNGQISRLTQKLADIAAIAYLPTDTDWRQGFNHALKIVRDKVGE